MPAVKIYIDDFGANTVPGTTDMTAAFRAAALALEDGGSLLGIPGTTYKITDVVNFTNDDIVIDLSGVTIDATELEQNTGTSFPALNFSGSVSLSTTLASSAAADATTITVASATGISVGDGVTIKGAAASNLLTTHDGGNVYNQCVNRVIGISGTTVTLEWPLPYAFDAAADTPTAVFWTPIRNAALRGGIFLGGGARANYAPNSGSIAIAMQYTEGARVSDIYAEGFQGHGVRFCDFIDCQVSNSIIRGHVDSFGTPIADESDGFGGVYLKDGQGGGALSVSGKRCRHVVEADNASLVEVSAISSYRPHGDSVIAHSASRAVAFGEVFEMASSGAVKIGGTGFANRADLVSAVAAGGAWSNGDIISDGVSTYVAVSGSTAISDLPGLEPFGTATPDHWAENTTPGTTDMTAAIQSAVAYGDVNFSGVYLISATIPIPSDRTLSGVNSGSEIVASDAAWVRYEAFASAVEKGGFTSNSKPMLSNTDPTNGNENIVIQDLKLTGSLTGSNHMIHLRAVDNLTICRNRTSEGLSAFAVLKSTDVSIVDNRVSGFRNGGIDTWEGCKRVVISRNHVDCNPVNSDGSNIGIFVTAQPTDSTDTDTLIAEDYTVTDNIITAAEGTGIWIGGGATTRGSDEVRRISVTTNTISGADNVGIIVEQGRRASIVENNIFDIGSHGILARRLGPSGPAVDDLRISGNYFRDIGLTDAASHFISLDLQVTNPVITENVGRGSTHEYALFNRGTNSGLISYGNRWDAGTSGTLNDLGIDSQTLPPSGVTLETTWDAGAVPAGSQTSTTETVTGAALGDAVRVAANASFSGMRLWAEVTAADTVTIYLTNNTAAAIDPSIRTIKIRVDKFDA